MSQRLILLCDDNEDNRVVFTAVLEHAGYAVLVAENGAEGVEQAQEFTPSLILLDLMMPGLDGWEVVALLKAHPVTEGIPVVAVTADVLASKRALKEAGFCALVPKPVLPKQLLQAVEQCLEEKSRRGDAPIEWMEVRVGL